jgi:mRNA-degrading endonuclease toxin of MazEF toxin-antitoxin module
MQTPAGLYELILTPQTGLSNPLQLIPCSFRGLDTSRFIRKLGQVSADTIEEIAAAIAGVVEYS